MLFDLRGRGRRRTVQGIYLGLAVLMGGGLVFFGVGGTGVGLFNSNSNGGGGSGNDVLEKQLSRTEKRAQRHPGDAAAWASLARTRFQVAGSGDNFSQTSLAYTNNGLKELRAAGRAWRRYVALEPKPVDVGLARLMSAAFSEVNDAKGAVGALEIVVEQQPAAATYQQLAVAAYYARRTRTAELATAEAIRRTPKADRPRVRAQIAAAKTSAQRGGQRGVAAPPSSTVPVQPQGKG